MDKAEYIFEKLAISYGKALKVVIPALTKSKVLRTIAKVDSKYIKRNKMLDDAMRLDNKAVSIISKMYNKTL